MKRPLVKRWLTGCGIVLLVVLAAFRWYVHLFMQAFSMQNQVYQEIRSPNGKYMATLAYSDGMTYGYFYVCVQPAADWHPLQANDPIPHDEVAEVAAEGLNTITWVGSHKLIVDYAKSDCSDKTEFVLQKKEWRDVRIAYRGS